MPSTSPRNGLGVDQRFQALKEYLHVSIWYVPASMGIAALLLAVAAIAVDRHVAPDSPVVEALLYGGTVEGARSILASLAGSLVTLAGLVFSMTVVALSFASSQQGPRILRNFPADRGNQVVMGWFIGSFLYCIVVSSSLRGGHEAQFVPRFAITLGLVLSTASLAFLVYFVQRVARMMQTEDVIREIRARLDGRVRKAFPETDDDALRSGAPREEDYPNVLRASASGYIQGIDYQSLGSVAEEDGLRLLCTRRAGHFVVQSNELARASGPLRDPDRYEKAFVIGPTRTESQDVEFAFRQLVEIALRALSPGVNDPYTAVACIDHLTAALAVVAGRASPRWSAPEPSGRVRARTVTFDSVLATAWNQIRQHGSEQPAIAIRLLEGFEQLAQCVSTEEQVRALDAHRRDVHQEFEKCDAVESDRTSVRHHDRATSTALAEALLRIRSRPRATHEPLVTE